MRLLKSKMMACVQCKKEVRIRPYRFHSFRFCSRACLWRWHNANDRVLKTCAICAKEFFVIRFREKRAKYCSRTCYYKAMTRVGTIDVECSACGKHFMRAPSRSKYPNPCCSIKCRGLLMRREQPGSAASARAWFLRRGFIMSCNRCGDNKHPEILIVHHKDRNRKNNAVSNLEIICPYCHALEHYS
jgi:hypothetical protein